MEVQILSFPPFFFGFVAQPESERKNSTLEVAGSNPAEALFQSRIWRLRSCKFRRLSIFRVRLTAGRIALNDETEVRILHPKPILFISGCSADGYTGLFWKQVFAGSNPATQTNFTEGRSTDGYMGMPWEHVFVSSNLTALTNLYFKFEVSNFRLFSSRRGLNGKGAGLRNQFMRVRISPSALNFRVGDVT